MWRALGVGFGLTMGAYLAAALAEAIFGDNEWEAPKKTEEEAPEAAN